MAVFSPRGPSLQDASVKPNIAAPGVAIRSSLPDGGYGELDSTASATAHVAGAVALLWSAYPELRGDVTATRELLDQSAVDVEDTSCGGDAARNNVWGEGRLDVYGAFERRGQRTIAGR